MKTDRTDWLLDREDVTPGGRVVTAPMPR